MLTFLLVTKVIEEILSRPLFVPLAMHGGATGYFYNRITLI